MTITMFPGNDGVDMEMEVDLLEQSEFDDLMEAKKSVSSFLKSKSCLDAFPKSSIIHVIDDRTTIRSAMIYLAENDSLHRNNYAREIAPRHDIQTAPLYSESLGRICGLFGPREILEILVCGSQTKQLEIVLSQYSVGRWLSCINNLRRDASTISESKSEDYPALETLLKVVEKRNENLVNFSGDEVLAEVLQDPKNLITEASSMSNGHSIHEKTSKSSHIVALSPDASLYTASHVLQKTSIVGIPIYDKDVRLCKGVLTEMLILRLLVDEYREERNIFDKPIKQLGVGAFLPADTIYTVKLNEVASKGLSIFHDNNISSLPVLDEKNKPIGVFTLGDLTSRVVAGVSQEGLDMPVGAFLTTSSSSQGDSVNIAENLVTCSVEESVQNIFIKFQEHQVQSLVCVDEDGYLTGIVTLKDLISFFVSEV